MPKPVVAYHAMEHDHVTVCRQTCDTFMNARKIRRCGIMYPLAVGGWLETTQYKQQSCGRGALKEV